MRSQRNSWTDIDESSPTVGFLPVGSTEQHGPHAPVGTDTIIAQAIAEETTQMLDRDCLCLPTIPVGVAPYHGTFPGTLSVRPETLRRYVVDIIQSLADTSVETVVLVNGHGGNGPTLANVARERTQTTELDVYGWEWMRAVDEDVGHAGELETAILLHLCPGDVGDPVVGDAMSWDSVIDGGTIHHYTDGFSENGVVGDATGATAAQGQEAFERATAMLVSFVGRVTE